MVVFFSVPPKNTFSKCVQNNPIHDNGLSRITRIVLNLDSFSVLKWSLCKTKCIIPWKIVFHCMLHFMVNFLKFKWIKIVSHQKVQTLAINVWSDSASLWGPIDSDLLLCSHFCIKMYFILWIYLEFHRASISGWVSSLWRELCDHLW